MERRAVARTDQHFTLQIRMTVAENPYLSRAFLGHKVGANGELFVRVCMCCDERAIVEAEAARLKCKVTHGICAFHFQESMAQITGDRSG